MLLKVNMFVILHKVSDTIKKGNVPKLTISCLDWKSAKPDRNKNSKWYVTRQEYAPDKYPHYCSGFFLLMTADVIRPLYNASFHNKFFWIDDVWMTGILREKTNVTIDSRRDVIFQQGDFMNNLMSIKGSSETYAAHLDKSIDRMTLIWNHLTSIHLRSNRLDDIQQENLLRFHTIFANTRIFSQ